MKLTREEKNWILYDVGNSAFVLLVSTILPIYFNYLAQGAGLSDAQYLAYWGYAASIATIIVAIMGYAWGYIGSCIPFVLSLLLVLGAEKLIFICISAYLFIAVFAIFLRTQFRFWILAVQVDTDMSGNYKYPIDIV